MAQPRMLPFVFVLVLAMARPAAPQVESTAQPMPVLENVEFMDLMIKPAYDVLRQTMEHPPADRKGWAAIYQQAARLAELENLLFLRTRSGESRRTEWASAAGRARDASARLANAAALGLRSAQAADFDRMRGAFPAIADACTACHRAFAREAPVIKP
ncbi:MAG TPA: cytochrome c [Vicinamibacterales bacterium]|nr:cytochrome c [Vicinamibacterales bacterium]